jgi:hypothetical protein
MRDSKLAIVMGLMTALVSLSVGLMRDSRTILVIGLLIVLASLVGCAVKIRYPKGFRCRGVFRWMRCNEAAPNACRIEIEI